MGASATLLKFAKSRESAYLQYGRLDGARARAVTKIRQVADFYSQHSEEVQLRAVTQVEAEIRTLLPSEESRYTRIREQMLTLLSEAKNILSHAQNANSLPKAHHEGTNRTPKGDQGTQLLLI